MQVRAKGATEMPKLGVFEIPMEQSQMRT